MATTTILLNFPPEILHHIASYLSYGSRLALSYTCRELYSKLDNPNLRPRVSSGSGKRLKPYSAEDLLEIELWPEFTSPLKFVMWPAPYNQYYACCFCLTMLPAYDFLCENDTSRFSKDSNREMSEVLLRECSDCELARPIWTRLHHPMLDWAADGVLPEF
ncbi:hypothetical protein V493_03790 [Pseudogymnoascus sp. VKM F-4281 (FW-2241)]|nr:hypothetical protein V493_03790 [Pseudogymnoascus sp. VKM F-4281 (FW-2241)]